MKRVLLSLLLLSSIYAMVIASLHPIDLAFGILVSGALLYVFRSFIFGGKPEPMPGLLRRCAAFVPFVGAVAWDIIRGTWEVALIVLHLRPLRRSGTVKVPVGDRTPTGTAVLALVKTLSPGAFLVETDEEYMLFHLIDASDPDAFREECEDFYQRYQRRVFP